MTVVDGVDGAIVESRHEGGDDLLSAGLGITGLRQPPPRVSSDPDTAERRRSIWHAWRAIADLRPGSVDRVPHVAGREFSAHLRLPGDVHAHRAVVQIPDGFDRRRPCLVVAPASGSRGVYGAIAVAGPVALSRGCAVVYTDKGAGSDFAVHGRDRIYVPHAHSEDNPESRWGEHVLLAARFGLAMLDRAGLRRPAFTAANTRIVAVGLSNGGAAVLRATEIDVDGVLDAAVAAAPNIHTGWTGARPLYDFATEAALYQSCLLGHQRWRDAPFADADLSRLGQRRCAALRCAGWLDTDTPGARASEAYDRLRAAGWSETALRLAGQNVSFDLWRAIAVTYSSAYGRHGPDVHPCGFSFAAVDATGRPRPATTIERMSWRSDASGLPPTAGVAIIDPNAGGDDEDMPGLSGLRALWTGHGPDARRVRA